MSQLVADSEWKSHEITSEHMIKLGHHSESYNHVSLPSDWSDHYHSLAKKGPWAEHLTSLPKRGMGALSIVSAFNHERAPTSCLQWLEALEANNCTQNNVQRNHQRLQSRVLTAHNTPNGTANINPNVITGVVPFHSDVRLTDRGSTHVGLMS